MRPKSIVNFERVVLLGILIGIANTWLSWGKMLALAQAQAAAQGSAMKIGPGFLVGTQVVGIAIFLLLLWLIARKGSPIAKWIYVVLAVIGLIFAVIGIGKAAALGTVPLVLSIVSHLLTLASLWFLFQPDAKAWFSEGRSVDPNDLR
jgi:hypothetical protein